MTVADRIKERRMELELSQTDLAKKAGYTDKTSVSKLEHSGNNISMKQLKRIASALSTTVENLMGWSDEVVPLEKTIDYVLNNKDKLIFFEPYVKEDKPNDVFFEYIKRLYDLPPDKRKAIYDQIDFQTMRNKE